MRRELDFTDGIKLPIKVVPALEPDFYRPDTGGGNKKVFVEPTAEFREHLASEVIQIRDHFRETFELLPQVPAVARAKVRGDAVAKSHRPNRVLSSATCPIIGVEGLGQILVSVTRTGLENLARAIEQDQTKEGIANLSTLERFEAYIPEVTLPESLRQPAKVKLFRHHIKLYDEALERAFLDMLARSEPAAGQEVRYGPGLKVFRVERIDRELLSALSAFVGTQSIDTFPIYYPLRTAAIAIRNANPRDCPAPEPDIEYPVVGVVDSGTTPRDPLLAPWIVDRLEYVPPGYRNHTHGNFVSSLIVHAKHLNHNDDRFPGCSAKMIDVVALGTNGTSEDELLTILEDALTQRPDIRVWNLSLGTSESINNNTFSDFAVALDRLQDEYGTLFVLAAGNYHQPPFRGWPPEDLHEADRICAPADSVRAIVVGSIAHLHHPSARVLSDAPSPFSRRGPGPLYLPKPELSHIGGNCKSDGTCSQIGVLSLDGRGNIVEDIGTSFAAPLVTTLSANLQHQVIGGASRLLTRAMLIHSAALHTGRVDPIHLLYRGFGKPPDVEEILGCEPWQCTLIFEISLAANVAFEKAIFPMPSCLYVNPDTVKANILMTLVYEPFLDASYGSEYCRTNIEVSLGTYDVGSDGKHHQKKQVPEDPQLKGSGYEKDLVEYGFKWSPVKVYRREMVRGVKGQQWRLDMSVHHRSGFTPIEPQNAALVITVADPNKQASVYNDMVVQMNQFGWAAADLQIRPRLRT